MDRDPLGSAHGSTARTADKDIEAAFAEGVTDYITKPFAVAQMRARVRSWLSRSAEVET